MRKLTLFSIFAMLITAFSAKAQDSTSTSDAGSLTISGYVDVYYTYNFNKPPFAGNNPLGVPQPLGYTFQNQGRIFDIKHNQFSVGLAQTKFDYKKGRLNGVIDLTFGPNAELGNFGNIFGSMISIKQAYMAYSFTDKLVFTIGQFGTHVGYELIDAPLNYNYSLSYLFGNGPFYHTGAKLSYAFSDKFGVMGGVVNGWDNMYDFNKHKSFIGQVFVAPVDGWALYLNYIGGDDKNGLSFPTIAATPDSIKTVAHLFDITTTYQVSDDFKIGLNAAYGFGNLLPDSTDASKYKNASWYGAALYLNYNITDKFGLGLRAEHFSDKDQVRYVGAALGSASYNEVTLTGDIKFMDGSFNIKPEFRLDFASKDVFTKYDGDGVGSATSIQPTLGAAFIYKY